MTDKDMGERRELAAAFPAATMQLCLFHMLRSFSRELTQEKMGVKAGLRDALLTVFNGMASARSGEEFEQQCAALADLDIPAASQYFKRHTPVSLLSSSWPGGCWSHFRRVVRPSCRPRGRCL